MTHLLSPRRRSGPNLKRCHRFTLDRGLRRDDAATNGFALRFARAHRVSHHLANSNASWESVCTCTPVPADCTSPLTMCRRLPTTAPANPCRDTGIDGRTVHVLAAGSYASSARKVYILCASWPSPPVT